MNLTSEKAAPRDWAALGDAIRRRRFEMGIPTQRAAANRAGIHLNTWHRLEIGQPIRMTSLAAIATALQWPASYPAAILHGNSEVGPMPVQHAQLNDLELAPPALLFVASDGARHAVDSDAWNVAVLSSRDRAFLQALLGLAAARLAAVSGPPDPIEEAQ